MTVAQSHLRFCLFFSEEFSDDTEKLGETLPETNSSTHEKSMVGSWKMWVPAYFQSFCCKFLGRVYTGILLY